MTAWETGGGADSQGMCRCREECDTLRESGVAQREDEAVVRASLGLRGIDDVLPPVYIKSAIRQMGPSSLCGRADGFGGDPAITVKFDHQCNSRTRTVYYIHILHLVPTLHYISCPLHFHALPSSVGDSF